MPTFRTSGNVANASRTTLAWTHPGTVQVGDICLLGISQDGNGSAITAPDANWIPLTGSPNTTGTGGERGSAWYRRMQAGEPGASTGNFTWTTADFSAAVYGYWSGGLPSGNPQDVANSKIGSTTTSVVLPSITTVTDGDQLVVLEMEAANGTTHTGPGTERQDIDGGSLYDLTQATAGATGTQTVNITAGIANSAFLVALAPGSGGGAVSVFIPRRMPLGV